MGLVWKNTVNDFFCCFFNRICCHSFFSSEVPYVSVNCKVHYPEDIIGWQPAKTVWQNMQMRALGVVLKNGIGFYGRCMADVWESRLFFQCFFSQFFTMQPIFFMIFLLYYCTDVKTVKCTIQRTSSAGSLRKPSDKSCRCAHLSAPWVEADFITQGITHWVKTTTTTRATCVARIRRRRIRGLRDVPAHLFDHGCARTVDANPRVASVVCASVVYEMCRRILLQLYFTVFFRDYRYL